MNALTQASSQTVHRVGPAAGGFLLSRIMRFDHVGVTVKDLGQVTAFFVGLGLEVEGRTFVEGEFIDTVIAIPDSRTETVMLRTPDGGTGVELSSFVWPDPGMVSSAAMANELVLRSCPSKSMIFRPTSIGWPWWAKRAPGGAAKRVPLPPGPSAS
ncbi:hypothetical protein OOZ51_20365 [Arthrobacter sp. MI7-26]|uniref:hypothetical protein n=1 Tax=Arthrobacter sp. MI7-26 TaxID=2993653 RepID=UPI002248A8FB|nr:hypothetical protein [Arthrobacter sp. MI7-26]MCX2750140.1 hypothetical protein [Arthrobacter sp. MI7-26]